MNGGLFGVRFSVLEHENGAVALVDYLSTFATAPFMPLHSKHSHQYIRQTI